MNKQSYKSFHFYVALSVTMLACLSLILLVNSSAYAQAAGPTPTPPIVTQPSDPADLNAIPAIAPNYKSGERDLPDLGRVGVDMAQQRPLTIRTAIELALQHNKDIEVARDNVKVSEYDLSGARGVFEPHFGGQSYFERTETPNASFFGGSALTQTNLVGALRLDGLTPVYGGNYRVEFSNVRNTTDNSLTLLSPAFQTGLSLNYSQPLVRGRSIDSARRVIEISKKNLGLTDSQFRQRTIEVITNVQRAYWDLVFALRNLQIQRDAVSDTRKQLDHNKRLVEEGILAPIDIVSIDAQLANYEQAVYAALDDVSRAENNLKNMIALDRSEPIWDVAIVPTDPVDLRAPAVSLPEAMKTALESRPELQQSNAAISINQIDQQFFKDQTRPQIDLVASYSTAGLAGGQNPDFRLPFSTGTGAGTALQLPANLLGGYGQSLANLAAQRYPSFRVGLQFSIPLRNQTAEAQLGRTLVEGQRVRTQREQLEQAIQVDVRNALQAIRTAEARLHAAAATREASELQYASEQRKLDAGQSTLFLLLDRQTSLTTARGNELRAQTDLNKAIAELQRATGNALVANNVVSSIR